MNKENILNWSNSSRFTEGKSSRILKTNYRAQNGGLVVLESQNQNVPGFVKNQTDKNHSKKYYLNYQ